MTRSIHLLPRRPRVVLLTGVTGFVGQAVLERFLREEALIHVVIRSGRGGTAIERLDELLTRTAFDAWREEVGPAGVAKARAHLHVIDADLTRGLPRLPNDLDLVVHSASSVSFDDPWDDAVRSNVVGPRHLYDALLESGADPHVIHISTAYVGTDRADVARETSVSHDADWRTEIAAAFDLRRSLEAEVPAGDRATRTDIDARMRTEGRRRAAELGWTDAYTMTKALGERVAETSWEAAGHLLTVLRPTIIESAISRPYPGWIDGFKVADPLIAAFAKDRLVAFPGHPDGILDIVPVDVVVDAVMAAATVPHETQDARYLHVGTGVSNPISLDEFREHIERYIHAHPWTDREGRPIRPRAWRFLAPGDLESWAARRSTALRNAGRVLDLAPTRLARRSRTRIQTALRGLSLLRAYVAIYQPYSCSRTVYDDARTRALLARADELGVAGELDVTRIDWSHYLRSIHMPGLTRVAEEHRRPRSGVRRLPTDRPAAATHRGAVTPRAGAQPQLVAGA